MHFFFFIEPVTEIQIVYFATEISSSGMSAHDSEAASLCVRTVGGIFMNTDMEIQNTGTNC